MKVRAVTLRAELGVRLAIIRCLLWVRFVVPKVVDNWCTIFVSTKRLRVMLRCLLV